MKRGDSFLPSTHASVLACAFCVLASFILCGCLRPAHQSIEASPASQATPVPVASSPEKEILAAAPQPVAVLAAITRVFEGTVTGDPKRFLVGDFDGDGSQDLVAVVTPVKGELSNLNSEYARWKIEDPRKIRVFRTVKDLRRLSQAPDPVRVEQNDLLLALIHGHGPYGWRNPEATNAYLMKNAVGRDLGCASLSQALRATDGRREMLSLRGDIIREKLGNDSGFIFWTGADYAWFSLESRKGADSRGAGQIASR